MVGHLVYRRRCSLNCARRVGTGSVTARGASRRWAVRGGNPPYVKRAVFDMKREAGRGRAAYRGSLLYAMKYSSKRRLAAAAGGP